jgi:hypothetical protein
MVRKVSAPKVRQNLGQLLEEVYYKGDQYVLDLHEHRGIRIVSPKTFLEVLRAHHERGRRPSQEG